MPFQMFVTVSFTALNTVLTAVLIALMTVLLMVFQTEIIISLQFSQISWKGRVMIFHADSKIEPMNMISTCTTFLIVSHAVERKPVIPFQILIKKVDTEVHTSFQLVPSHLQMVSAIPLMRLMAAWKISTIPF